MHSSHYAPVANITFSLQFYSTLGLPPKTSQLRNVIIEQELSSQAKQLNVMEELERNILAKINKQGETRKCKYNAMQSGPAELGRLGTCSPAGQQIINAVFYFKILITFDHQKYVKYSPNLHKIAFQRAQISIFSGGHAQSIWFHWTWQ